MKQARRSRRPLTRIYFMTLLLYTFVYVTVKGFHTHEFDCFLGFYVLCVCLTRSVVSFDAQHRDLSVLRWLCLLSSFVSALSPCGSRKVQLEERNQTRGPSPTIQRLVGTCWNNRGAMPKVLRHDYHINTLWPRVLLLSSSFPQR